MSTLKFIAATAFAASMGVAFAQSTPPNTSATNPAVGAGQRSTQNTPMGQTGTPAGGGAAAQGSTAGSTAGSTGMSGTTGSGTTGSGTMSSGSTMSSDTSGSMAASTGSGSGRAARADRN